MRLTVSFLLLALLASAAAVPGSDFVNAKVCAACHPKIAETYRQTGMGRSLYRPTPSNTVEDYARNNDFFHPLSDTHYAMTQREGAYFQRRWQIGFDGKESNVEELKIDYVIGSGNHARSYLHKTAAGAYIELPLSWYAESGGSWAMSPGFDEAHPQTRRFISYECMFCHNAVPKIPPGHDAPGSDPIFSGDLPEGIDCQRCHGPGGQHVRIAQTAGAKPEAIRAAIVNPARLTPALGLDVCLQCHLEPTSAEIPSLIRRFERAPFSFVPGQPLSRFLLAFDHAPGVGNDDKFEIVNSSAYRLRKSQCFLQSKGALTCLTCHDPHKSPRGVEAVNRYTAACRQCHAQTIDKAFAAGTHPAATECTSCHMPKRRTEDVVHAVMTDHLIQRRPPLGDVLGPLTERHPSPAEEFHGEVVPYYPSSTSNAADTLYQAVAQVALRHRPSEEAVVNLTRQIEQRQPREAEFYLLLGDALDKIGKPRDAAAAYRQALRRHPDSPRALLALAASLKASQQIPPAAAALDHAIQIAPQSAPAWFQSGALDFASAKISAAIEKMRKALSFDADLTGAHTGLAELLWRSGNMPEAEQQLRDALRLDPYDASAYNLLGRTLAGNGQQAEALFDFEKATRLRPGYAPHLYDYALELFNLNRPDDAQTAVEQALQANPDMAEAHELLGTLFAGKRQLSEAAREYSEAVRLKPDFARAHFDLARVLAAQGDRSGAIDHLRQAAAGADPQIAQLATRALQSMGANVP